MVIFYALMSAITFGTADFLGGFSSRKNSTTATVAWAQAAGLVTVLIAAPLMGADKIVGSDLLWGMAGGVSGAMGVMVLFRGPFNRYGINNISCSSSFRSCIAGTLRISYRGKTTAVNMVGCCPFFTGNYASFLGKRGKKRPRNTFSSDGPYIGSLIRRVFYINLQDL